MTQFKRLPERTDNIASIAFEWCSEQTQGLTDEGKLEWAKARINRRELLKLEKNPLIKRLQLHRKYIEDWAQLVADVSTLCTLFYTENAGDIDLETAEKIKREKEAIALQFPEPTEEQKLASKRFEAKMQAESGYMPASYKENPDLSPDKIQLELEDGVAYISKKSGWVLSQF